MGLVARVLGKELSKVFVVDNIECNEEGFATFQVGGNTTHVILRGSDTVTVASALNHYLRHYARVTYDWDKFSLCGVNEVFFRKILEK